MRISHLAGLLSVPWEGADGEVTAAASLESATGGHLSFVGNRKAAVAGSSSLAGCLIVPPEFPAGRTLMRAADPRGAFARAIGILHPATKPPAGIHPSATIAPSAILGEGVSIGPYVSIAEDAVIGPDTVIGPGCTVGPASRLGSGCTLHARVTLYEKVTVGDRAVLHTGCVLGADGFGFVFSGDHYEKFPQIGTVELGDDVEIGANACVDRGALGVTRIGHGAKLDNLVHIGHNCQIGKHVVIAAQTGLSGGVIVEDYAVIGGQVGIGDKARIESRAVLGSGCGILTSKIVRQGQVVWGTPARPLKEYLEQLANMARLPKLKAEVARLRVEVAVLQAKQPAPPQTPTPMPTEN